MSRANQRGAASDGIQHSAIRDRCKACMGSDHWAFPLRDEGFGCSVIAVDEEDILRLPAWCVHGQKYDRQWRRLNLT